MAHPLDRPVWSALTTRQAHLARGSGEELRFPGDIEPFGATRDNSRAQLAALCALMPADGHVALFEMERITPPPGFISMTQAVCLQMTADALASAEERSDIVRLTAADAPEMQALAELTKPGPFHARTHELGAFLGVREKGRLVAMAGERLKVPGFTEISAVAIHPDARGRGFAKALMRQVAAGIAARGDKPFLHVYPHNQAAIALYRKLGLRHRADLNLNVIRRRLPGEARG
ncbi:MAG: GNAT family N-acetyltransferase [Rhizomicrobium sp.]